MSRRDYYENEDYDMEQDLTDSMLEEEADDYYEDHCDDENDEYEAYNDDEDCEKTNHFECQRAHTCCLGCEDCDLENECSMCTHDGNSNYCDHCTVADEY